MLNDVLCNPKVIDKWVCHLCMPLLCSRKWGRIRMLHRQCQCTNKDAGFYSRSIYFKNRLRDKHSQNMYDFWVHLVWPDSYFLWLVYQKNYWDVRKQWVFVNQLRNKRLYLVQSFLFRFRV